VEALRTNPAANQRTRLVAGCCVHSQTHEAEGFQRLDIHCRGEEGFQLPGSQSHAEVGLYCLAQAQLRLQLPGLLLHHQLHIRLVEAQHCQPFLRRRLLLCLVLFL